MKKVRERRLITFCLWRCLPLVESPPWRNKILWTPIPLLPKINLCKKLHFGIILNKGWKDVPGDIIIVTCLMEDEDERAFWVGSPVTLVPPVRFQLFSVLRLSILSSWWRRGEYPMCWCLLSINQSTHHPANPSASIGGPPPVGSQLFPTAPVSTLVVTRCLSVQGSFVQIGSLESGTLRGFLLWCLFWLEVTWPEGIEELPWIWDTCAR